MYKQKPIKQLSDEAEFELQFSSWKNDSHYWVEKDGLTICEWCNRIQPVMLIYSGLCLKNPEILRLIK